MREEVLEQFNSYIELCEKYETEPSFEGFCEHLLESYEGADGAAQ